MPKILVVDDQLTARDVMVTDKLYAKVAALESKTSRLEALLGLSEEAALIRDVDTLMDKFCSKVRDIMSAKYAGAILFDSKAEKVRSFNLFGADAEMRAQIGTPPINGIIRKLASSLVPLREKDFGAEWQSRIFPNHPPVYSFLGAPIRGPAECYGVMYVANKLGAEEFDEEESVVLKALATRMAVSCENIQLNAQLQERAGVLEGYTCQLKNLSRRLMNAREDEQRHIARELHDEIGQELTALKIHLQTAEKAPAESASAIAESLRLTEMTLQHVRSLCVDLRPTVLDDLGLVPAVRWLLNRQVDVGRFTSEFIADPQVLDLPIEVRTACYRIVQESLTNIVRHANAKNVSIRLRQNGEGLFLSVSDDGDGFLVSEVRKKASGGGSIGVLGMEERASLTGGRLFIESSPGLGTTVRVDFPKHRRETS